MKKSKDTFSAILKRAADVLFLYNPKGTSIGVFLGVVGDGLLKLFSPALGKFSSLDFSALATYHLIACGVVVMNIPSLFKRRELPKEIEDALTAIRVASPRLTEVQVRARYLALLSSVMERVTVMRERGPLPSNSA